MAIERVSGLTAGNYGLDEIVASGALFHLERMSHKHIWLVVSDKDGNSVTVNLHAKGAITANVERDLPAEGK